jgi:uncharacterized protein (TIGR04255 family)
VTTSAQRQVAVGLPEPDTRLLARPPLEAVICEVRASSDVGVALGSAEGLRLKEVATNAGLQIDRLEQTQQQGISVQVGMGTEPTPVVGTRSVGWQLVSAEGSIISVSPGVLSIQTTHYVSWEATFRPLLTGALAAFVEVLQPQIRHRLGLRYIDRLVNAQATKATAWRGRVTDSLLGPIADAALGDRVISSQQQVELDISGRTRALIRHGPFADGAVRGAISYMLDIDVFDVGTEAFEAANVTVAADELNKIALSVFQASITDSYLAELRGDE